MGHFPDSFSYSTLGGWAATRSSGMQSDRYGDIEDIVRGMRVVHPRGVVVSKPIPGRDSGPSVHEMILGSEGRLGVISECTVRIHRKPEVREVVAYLYPDWASGVEAMHDIARSEANPTFTRLSDGPETRFSLAMVSEPTTVKAKLTARGQDALFAYLRSRGWDTTEGMCLSYVCFEGSKEHVGREKAAVKKIVAGRGGISLGTGPGAIYDQKKFDTPYLRDFLLNYRVFGDVCETGVSWANLKDMHARVHERFAQVRAEMGGPGFMFCHMSHSYHGGACLYFTFAIPYTEEATALAEYRMVKEAVQQEFIDSGEGSPTTMGSAPSIVRGSSTTSPRRARSWSIRSSAPPIPDATSTPGRSSPRRCPRAVPTPGPSTAVPPPSTDPVDSLLPLGGREVPTREGIGRQERLQLQTLEGGVGRSREPGAGAEQLQHPCLRSQ